eukprot:CAMPEP_0178764746 /NCGR_PEP_ID=MMETSP0744-20121128/18002_1 /TAXON_ID=913974 /ORGANISM="Nitzschia punctata, Strain CCMP561" /LENGTH=103 /DNA_ID=CAMNT_0020420035 /DNA_START=337 /DNA_END=647 /DNA_ORIENTATION=-
MLPKEIALKFFLDNKALMRNKVKQWATRTRPVFPNCTLMPSYDLVQALRLKTQGTEQNHGPLGERTQGSGMPSPTSNQDDRQANEKANEKGPRTGTGTAKGKE